MLLDLVTAKVKDTAERLTYDDYIPAITAALARYSKHRPLEVVADLAGTGGHDLTLPAGWDADFSAVSQVEYPVGSVPEDLLERSAWTLYRAPDGLKLRMIDETPPLAAAVRITYTTLRREATVPAPDLDAVACLAASICLMSLAAGYGQSSDPTIQADVVSYQSKTDTYRRLAEAFERQYFASLSIDPKAGPAAAAATASATTSRTLRLTHGDR